MRHIYTVIEAENLSELVDRVNTAMSDGWRSQGGVCCVKLQTRSYGLISCRFMQAMEKRVSR